PSRAAKRRNGLSVIPDMGARRTGLPTRTDPTSNPARGVVGLERAKLTTSRACPDFRPYSICPEFSQFWSVFKCCVATKKGCRTAFCGAAHGRHRSKRHPRGDGLQLRSRNLSSKRSFLAAPRYVKQRNPSGFVGWFQ